ncbi:hypothetical protein PPERSA_11633 [Pseudocohnilembus persalinus]|uniref:Sel1 repeat family protein n=1 Tax=Pseudocohnilembus persalinus TaxID=266149 RepID=A0A0V0Q9Y7_PSEPJ|nr:hypothetical protein PPERSA_11633 [Pseudocohnilembus persalinus]|eukprot:KRW99032.1 hypothetical protein PPERSA_11633 [Pseudocohnilembus persalinus]
MDGSFNALTILEKETEQIAQNLTNIQKNNLIDYLNDKRFSEMLINLYFSGMQGNQEALISLGYRHWKGIGTPGNCSTAALYYDSVLKDLYNDDSQVAKINHVQRLDNYIHHKQSSLFDIFHEKDKLQVLEQINTQLGIQNDIDVKLQLGQQYYFGIGGLKQDYNKAFKIFKELQQTHQNIPVFQQKSILYAKQMLAEMYLKGQGTAVNYHEARKLFSQIQNQLPDGVAQNGLGYMYYHGLGVEQDIEKGINYFLDAARKGNDEGLYNYGSLLLMPGNQYIQKDFQKGQQILINSAELGNGYAQYALALLYLDGVDYYQNCEVSVNLMKTAAAKGPWIDHQKQGNLYFSKGEYRQALLNYIQSAMMGDEVGYLNAGILADKYQVFDENDYNYDKLQESLDQDQIYQILKQNKLLKYTNLYYFLYSDYLSILKDIEIEERYTVLKKLVSLPKKYNLNQYVSMKCFSLTSSDYAYSSVRLGDYYYYGIFEHQSYKRSFEQYTLAAKHISSNQDYSIAQGFYNMAYMTLHGLGTQKNLTLSRIYFDQSK